MTSPSLSITFKRGITGGLGLFGLFLFLPATTPAERDAGEPWAWVPMVIHIAAPLLGVALLSRWGRWRTLRPDTRFGSVFLAAFLTPTLGLALFGVEDLPEGMLVAVMLGLSISALWWVVWGQRMAPTPPNS